MLMLTKSMAMILNAIFNLYLAQTFNRPMCLLILNLFVSPIQVMADLAIVHDFRSEENCMFAVQSI